MEYGFYLLLLVLVIVFTLISNSFLTVSNWTQIAIASTFLLAAAAGLTLVLMCGEIDLSIGSIAYVAATVVYLTVDMPAGVSIAAGLSAGLLIGLFNGGLVGYLGMNSLLTTLGLMIAYRGIALVFTEGTVKQVGDAVAAVGRMKLFGVLPLIFLVALGLVLLFQWILRRTRLGAYWVAIGNNTDSARKIGVPVRRAKLAAYALCGISAAASGILLAAYLGEITTFTGRGNVFPGTLAGILLLIVIDNGLGTRGVSPFAYPFVVGALIFFAIYLDVLKNRRR